MDQINVNFKMNKALKNRFEKTCDNIGISLSTAFNIFAKAVVRENKIPFEVSGKLNGSIDTSIINPIITNIQRNIQVSNITNEQIDTIIKSLTGIIKDDGKTIDDYRNERLSKYEDIN